MNKQAYLEEIYNESFNDELEKVAISAGLVNRAIGSRIARWGGQTGSKQSVAMGRKMMSAKPPSFIANRRAGGGLRESVQTARAEMPMRHGRVSGTPRYADM